MLRINRGGSWCEVKGIDAIPIDISSVDFEQSFLRGVGVNNTSFQFQIPYECNAECFGHVLDRNMKVKCQRDLFILDAGAFCFSGYLYYESSEGSGKGCVLNVMLASGLVFFQDCFNTPLCELDLGTVVHSVENILKSRDEDKNAYNGTPYYYGLNWAGGEREYFDIKDLSPMIYDSAILDAISELCGTPIKSRYKDSEFFGRSLRWNPCLNRGAVVWEKTFEDQTLLDGDFILFDNPTLNVIPIQLNQGDPRGIIIEECPGDYCWKMSFRATNIVGNPQIVNSIALGSLYNAEAVSIGTNEINICFDFPITDATNLNIINLNVEGGSFDISNFELKLCYQKLAPGVEYELSSFLPCDVTVGEYMTEIIANDNLIPVFDEKRGCLILETKWDLCKAYTHHNEDGTTEQRIEEIKGFYDTQDFDNYTKYVDCSRIGSENKIADVKRELSFEMCRDNDDDLVPSPGDPLYVEDFYDCIVELCEKYSTESNTPYKLNHTAPTETSIIPDTDIEGSNVPEAVIPQSNAGRCNTKWRRLQKVGCVPGSYEFPDNGTIQETYAFATFRSIRYNVNLGWCQYRGMPGMEEHYRGDIDIYNSGDRANIRLNLPAGELTDLVGFVRKLKYINHPKFGSGFYIMENAKGLIKCDAKKVLLDAQMIFLPELSPKAEYPDPFDPIEPCEVVACQTAEMIAIGANWRVIHDGTSNDFFPGFGSINDVQQQLEDYLNSVSCAQPVEVCVEDTTVKIKGFSGAISGLVNSGGSSTGFVQSENEEDCDCLECCEATKEEIENNGIQWEYNEDNCLVWTPPTGCGINGWRLDYIVDGELGFVTDNTPICDLCDAQNIEIIQTVAFDNCPNSILAETIPPPDCQCVKSVVMDTEGQEECVIAFMSITIDGDIYSPPNPISTSPIGAGLIQNYLDSLGFGGTFTVSATGGQNGTAVCAVTITYEGVEIINSMEIISDGEIINYSATYSDCD